jgi:hypothetical protein
MCRRLHWITSLCLLGGYHLSAADAVIDPVVVPTPAANDQRVAIYTREHVEMALYAPLGATEARAVFTNRQDVSVLVNYTVEAKLGDPRSYEVDLTANETRGEDGRFVVTTGGQAAPRCSITSVDIMPIEEASGYVRLAEDIRNRVTVSLYRPETGGKRAYAVLVNNDDRPVTVTWTASGLIDGPVLTFSTTLDPRAVLGKDGSIRLAYHPVADPRWRTKVRVTITSVTPAPR